MRINSVPDVKCFCNNKNVLVAQSMVWYFVRHPVDYTNALQIYSIRTLSVVLMLDQVVCLKKVTRLGHHQVFSVELLPGISYNELINVMFPSVCLSIWNSDSFQILLNGLQWCLVMGAPTQALWHRKSSIHRGADKSLARPGRKKSYRDRRYWVSHILFRFHPFTGHEGP